MDIKKRLPKEYVKVPIYDTKKYDIIYDINVLPPGTQFKDVLELYFHTGMLIYDSSKGDKPTFHLKHLEKDVQIKEDKFPIRRDLRK